MSEVNTALEVWGEAHAAVQKAWVKAKNSDFAVPELDALAEARKVEETARALLDQIHASILSGEYRY
jgi:hypothetical protein